MKLQLLPIMIDTKTEQPMTEVDYQCLCKGTTRMPQKILKQLLQTAGQHLGVLRSSVCLPLG